VIIFKQMNWVNLEELESYLSNRSYFEGYRYSEADKVSYEKWIQNKSLFKNSSKYRLLLIVF
jgi:hypothetical protein